MTSLLKQLIPKLNRLSILQPISQTSSKISTQFRLFSNAPSLTPFEEVHNSDDKNDLLKSEIVKKISEQVQNRQEPLFAVVHVAGKQFKITSGDMIVIEGYWPPEAGDKICLNKIMLVGGKEFSLIGKPLIQNDLVKIDATVIEKTLSHTKTHFRKKRRKQYKRINFYRIPRTVLQINKIQFVGELDNPPDVSETKSRSL